MQQFEGFEKYYEQTNPLFCKFKETIYGFKQFGRKFKMSASS